MGLDMLQPGEKVVVRTVTYHYVGKVVKVEGRWLELENAAWLAESERWTTTLLTGKVRELEPYPDHVIISMDAVVDITPWRHGLFDDQV